MESEPTTLPPIPHGVYLRHLGQVGPQSLRSGAPPGTWVCQVERWRGALRHITATGLSAQAAMANALSMLDQPAGPKIKPPLARPSLSDLFS